MGKLILKDAFVEVDGVDLSDHFSQVAIESEKDVHDVTGFGAEMKEKALGLGDGKITGSVFQDYATASVDVTLWPIHEAGDPVDVVIRPTSAAVSATNPEYTMSGVLPSFSPISGSVGEPSKTDVTFENASQDGIVRTVA